MISEENNIVKDVWIFGSINAVKQVSIGGQADNLAVILDVPDKDGVVQVGVCFNRSGLPKLLSALVSHADGWQILEDVLAKIPDKLGIKPRQLLSYMKMPFLADKHG